MRQPWARPPTLALLITLLLGGCAPAATSPPPPSTPRPTATPGPTPEAVGRPPAGRFLFVEAWVHVDGTGDLPALMIDFPGYRFDRQARVLKSFGPAALPALASDDWGLLGKGSSRGGAAGGGAASELQPIGELPYTTTIGIFTGEAQAHMEKMRQAGVILHSVSADARLVATIDGEPVVLAPGERWERLVEADVTLQGGQGHYRVTSSLTNHGWLDRSTLDHPE